jgi:hypothetical protein
LDPNPALFKIGSPSTDLTNKKYFCLNDYPFLIAPSVFSNVYLKAEKNHRNYENEKGKSI